MKPAEGRTRVIIEEVQPAVDCGRYPAHRILGEPVTVTAAIFADGHDRVAAQLLYRHESERHWRTAPLTLLGNDMWTGSFPAEQLGTWRFAIQAWMDHFGTWCADLKKRLDAQPDPKQPSEAVATQDIPLALRTGAILLDAAATRARDSSASQSQLQSQQLKSAAKNLRDLAAENRPHYEHPITPEMEALVAAHPDLYYAAKTPKDLTIWVDRPRARYATWYELFPRSASNNFVADGKPAHGSFADVEALLPSIANMGFDIVYLPPIHPIGQAFRKGPNNNVNSQPGDEGSPWAIGSIEGGHKAIHSKLGTFADFSHLVSAARDLNMEIALDIAFQCSPDHPWVKDHPAWFIQRPDGTIQYAENPPKKYQDIYPLNFESSDWRMLWEELLSVFNFWIRHGVRCFRVDNPHTKSFHFWEWCITEIHKENPDVLFLSEAFTRPHLMYSLAKSGFTQSYTYFTWRNNKAEIEEYLKEITSTPVSNFFRPSLWPNTPDILHEFLQTGGRHAFELRYILAATLSSSIGIYGPAYELQEHVPFKPGSEEYLNSEKYEIRHWDRNSPNSIAPLITRVNQIRRENPALQSNESLHFHAVDNPQLIAYSKSTDDKSNVILTCINLDPRSEQAGWVNLDLGYLGLPSNTQFKLEDLLTGYIYTWNNRTNYIALRPNQMPAHIFRITR